MRSEAYKWNSKLSWWSINTVAAYGSNTKTKKEKKKEKCKFSKENWEKVYSHEHNLSTYSEHECNAFQIVSFLGRLIQIPESAFLR